jgi:hypothetical protein
MSMPPPPKGEIAQRCCHIVGWRQGQVSTSKLLTDLGVSAVGVFGGLPGSVFAGEYYAFDTFYPGEAHGAAKDYANFLTITRKFRAGVSSLPKPSTSNANRSIMRTLSEVRSG